MSNRFWCLWPFFCYILSVSKLNAGVLELPSAEQKPEFEEKIRHLDLDVPTENEREVTHSSGPSLKVRELHIAGIIEFPELGITRESVITHIEDNYPELRHKSKVFNSVAAKNELLAKDNASVDFKGEGEDEQVDTVEVQRLIFRVSEEQQKHGVNLARIKSLTDIITRLYRECGFILAKAHVPEQHVEDGVVILALLLGELGDVTVNNNKRHAQGVIRRVFNSAISKPVTSSDIEERLFLVNDLPGLSSRGYFESGSQVGETKFNVSLTEERLYNANVRVDNHGAPGSGEFRVYSDVFLYSPFGWLDQLQIGVLGAFEPANSTFGLLRYQTNILHPRLILNTGVSTNDFTVDQTLTSDSDASTTTLNLEGESLVLDGGATWKLKRARAANSSINFNFSEIETTFNILGSQASLTDVLQNIRLTYSFDKLNEGKRRLSQGSFSVTSSELIESSFGTQQTQAFIFEYNYSWLTYVPVPFSDAGSRLTIRSAGQYSESSLATSVQFGLGGPSRARSFEVNEFFGDQGVYLGLEWQFNGLGGEFTRMCGERLGDIIQPYLFFDAAYGFQFPVDEASSGSLEATYSSVGFGFKLNIKGIRGNVVLSRPAVEKVSSALADERDSSTNVFFDLQYSFH